MAHLAGYEGAAVIEAPEPAAVPVVRRNSETTVVFPTRKQDRTRGKAQPPHCKTPVIDSNDQHPLCYRCDQISHIKMKKTLEIITGSDQKPPRGVYMTNHTQGNPARLGHLPPQSNVHPPPSSSVGPSVSRVFSIYDHGENAQCSTYTTGYPSYYILTARLAPKAT